MKWKISCGTAAGAGLIVAVMLAPAHAPAQPPLCYPYRVEAQFINVAKEPHDRAVLIDVLEGGDMACIKSERPVGGRQWGYVVFKMRPDPGERLTVEGWAPMKYLKPMHTANRCRETVLPQRAIRPRTSRRRPRTPCRHWTMW
jgi:hypothetical protein